MQTQINKGLPFHLQVIYIAGIWHLLYIEPHGHVLIRVTPDNAVFNHVLEICKPSPDVAQVIQGVSPWTRVPVSGEETAIGTETMAKLLSSHYSRGGFHTGWTPQHKQMEWAEAWMSACLLKC